MGSYLGFRCAWPSLGVVARRASATACLAEQCLVRSSLQCSGSLAKCVSVDELGQLNIHAMHGGGPLFKGGALPGSVKKSVEKLCMAEFGKTMPQSHWPKL